MSDRANDHDYVYAPLAFTSFAALFPQRRRGDRMRNDWPFLRRQVRHHWYVDAREPDEGFINVDETSVLLAVARAAGGPGLEIGALRGWSTVHLASVLPHLDSIDPRYGIPALRREIEEMLARAGLRDRCALHAGLSPGKIVELDGTAGRSWALIFIDGNHDGDGPRRDAETAARFARPDAAIVFHDLMSPDVAEGLRHLRAAGWRCRVYHTMQIMGVACRGTVTLPDHVPDPTQHWDVPGHLRDLLS